MKISKKNTPALKKIIVALLLVALFSAAAYGALASIYNLWPLNELVSTQENTKGNTAPNSDTDSEPSASDRVAEDKKDQAAQDNTPNQGGTNDDNSTETVSVTITDAAQYDDTIEVRAFVPSHIENGTCTLIMTYRDYTIRKEQPARADASSTICLPFNIPRSEFDTPGTWNAMVTYTSPNAAGKSTKSDVRVE